MSKRRVKGGGQSRRQFTKEFKQDAVQMMLDGHSANSVAKNLGLGSANLLYRWKAEILAEGGPAAETLDHQVRELRQQLHRVERERDILKKALSIFGRDE
jgi:transposase